MNVEVKGAPLPVAICKLSSGETIRTETGAMSWMSSNMKMGTNASGGLKGMFGRALSGESMLQNTYTAVGSEGMLAMASSFPGDILVKDVTNCPIIAQKHAFLGCESTVNCSTFFQKKLSSGLFGGEGFIMQKYEGSGKVILEIDGSIQEYELRDGESMICDTGVLALMDATCKIEIETVKGIGNKLLGGEGFFNTKVTGPGKVWLQSMPVSAMASTLIPYLPTSSN